MENISNSVISEFINESLNFDLVIMVANNILSFHYSLYNNSKSHLCLSGVYIVF